MKVKIRKANNCSFENILKEDIKQAVCAGVLLAEEKREETKREMIKNTKLTGWEKVKVGLWWALAVLAFVAGAICLVAANGEWIVRMEKACKCCVIGFLFVFVARLEYAMCKNHDKQFGYNMITLLIALASFVVSIIR